MKWNLYEKLWLTTAVILSSVVSYNEGFSFLGVSTFLTGVTCVLLTAKGTKWAYIPGLYNVFSYAYISYTNGLFGEMGLNLLFFLPMQFIGFYHWSKHTEDKVVVMKKLTAFGIVILALGCALTIGLAGYLLSLIKAQNSPYIDATTNVLSVVATFLMVWRYREQWLLYITLNVFTIIMWALRTTNGGIEGLMMMLMWIMYLTNAVYGWFVWTKGANIEEAREDMYRYESRINTR